MAAAVILNCWICKILLADGVRRGNTHHCAKFRQNRFFGCGYIAIFQIFITNATITCKILVKIGPVVSAENRLINGNCVACSRGSAYFVEYLRIYRTDFQNRFHHMKALYVQIMDSYLIFRFVEVRCHGNHIICERLILHGQKNWRILWNISEYTGQIFVIFSPYERSVCTDDGSVPYFPICQGTLPLQPKQCWEKWESNECGLIPPVFFALAFENDLEYHYLYVHVQLMAKPKVI